MFFNNDTNVTTGQLHRLYKIGIYPARIKDSTGNLYIFLGEVKGKAGSLRFQVKGKTVDLDKWACPHVFTIEPAQVIFAADQFKRNRKFTKWVK